MIAPPDTATLAAAIRGSLAKLAALSDEDLAARDARVRGLFQEIASDTEFKLPAARAFDEVCLTLLGHTVG